MEGHIQIDAMIAVFMYESGDIDQHSLASNSWNLEMSEPRYQVGALALNFC